MFGGISVQATKGLSEGKEGSQVVPATELSAFSATGPESPDKNLVSNTPHIQTPKLNA